MKKLGLLVIPLMVMSFLVGCNDGPAFQGNPLTITCTKGPMTLHLYSLVDNDYEESYVNIKWAKNNKGPIHSENCLIPFTNDPVVILSFSLEENESISFVGDNPDGFSFLNNKEFMRNIAFSNDIETSDSEFKVSGNVMSLIDSKKYEIIEQMPSSACFMSLFAQSGVVDASELTLPCKKLTFGCYNEMFAGCSTRRITCY